MVAQALLCAEVLFEVGVGPGVCPRGWNIVHFVENHADEVLTAFGLAVPQILHDDVDCGANAAGGREYLDA